MLNFIGFLLLVFIGGFITLMLSGLFKGKTIPVDAAPIVYTEPLLTGLPKTKAKNTHWFTHTFERPRKK